MSTTERPMTLRLDTKALNTLFPEGSEARVDLTRAIIQNFISKELNPASYDVKVRKSMQDAREKCENAIDEAVASVRDSLLRQVGIVDRWGTVTLHVSVREKIVDACRMAVNEAMTSGVNQAIAGAINDVRSAVMSRATQQVERITEEEIRSAVRAKINAALEKT